MLLDVSTYQKQYCREEWTFCGRSASGPGEVQILIAITNHILSNHMHCNFNAIITVEGVLS